MISFPVVWHKFFLWLYRMLRLLRWIIRASRCTDILNDLVISKDFAVSYAGSLIPVAFLLL